MPDLYDALAAAHDQQVEQSMAAITTVAALLGVYRRELRKQGFKRLEVLELVMSYQEMLFRPGQGDS